MHIMPAQCRISVAESDLRMSRDGRGSSKELAIAWNIFASYGLHDAEHTNSCICRTRKRIKDIAVHSRNPNWH